MLGVRAFDCVAFHPDCADVQVVDIGGFAFLFCAGCRILCNMEAVSPKLKDYASACASSHPQEGVAAHG